MKRPSYAREPSGSKRIRDVKGLLPRASLTFRLDKLSRRLFQKAWRRNRFSLGPEN
jgi:hypothetical protein